MSKRYETLLFDLDDTLYRNHEVAQLMKANIKGYSQGKLGIDSEYIKTHSELFYMDYGTTLAGLVSNGHKIDYDDWHHDVHGVLPYERLLHKDKALRKIIESLPQSKYIFTNADIKHAETVLHILGLRDLFKGIICFESVMEDAARLGLVTEDRPVVCKPSKAAFQVALQAAQCSPETTLFLDDSKRNVEGAASMGIDAVLVGSLKAGTSAVAEVEDLHSLPSALPQLWPGQQTADKGATSMNGSTHVNVSIA